MALEPEMPSLDEGENPELLVFRRRFIDGRRALRVPKSKLATHTPTSGTESSG